MVLCFDAKTQIQALQRTQTLLPMGLGYVEGATHDDTRHGTTTLGAALDLATGKVLTQCRPCHWQGSSWASCARSRSLCRSPWTLT